MHAVMTRRPAERPSLRHLRSLYVLIMPTAPTIEELRLSIARMERRGPGRKAATLRFGVPAIDQHLPGGGLAAGALHEVACAGAEAEHGAAAALLLAGLLARRRGPVLWALERRDLFAPALAGAGLHPDRVVFAEAGRTVLLVMEEALRHAGLAGVVGEVGRLGLTASRRLQLAAEGSGVPGFALRRTHGEAMTDEPNAAMTRWRVIALPSPPPLAHAPGVPGLSRALWQLDLVRCRGGAPATWIVEACDAQGRLALAADTRDRQIIPLRNAG
jgi:protein ImuA